MAFGTEAFGESAFGEDDAEAAAATATLPRPRPPGRIAPNGLGFPPIRRTTIAGQQCFVTGIAPSELVGVPFGSTVVSIQSAAPSGIASINGFGVPTLSSGSAALIHPGGIAAAEVVGVPFGRRADSDALADTPQIVRRPPGRVAPGGAGFVPMARSTVGATQSLLPAGIGPYGSYTNQAGFAYTNQAGDRYTIELFARIGDPQVANQTGIHPSGIASTNAFGTPTLVSRAHISPVGIASTNAFGTPNVHSGSTVTIHPVGIASTNRFGVIGHLSIHPSGIESTNRFGIPKVVRAAQWNVQEPFAHWQIGFPRGHWNCGDPHHRTLPPAGYGLGPYGETEYGA